MTSGQTRVTAEIAEFVSSLSFEDLPPQAVDLGKRCLIDGLGLILAGSSQPCGRIIRRHCLSQGRAGEATIFGRPPERAAAPLAALANGTAGHALDWDDTQLSASPDRIYGLLTHPTVPPLTAGLALAEKLGRVSGQRFLTAFLAGFEVECKMAEAINPAHYKRGFHSSGTVGVFGAAAAAAKLLDLDQARLRHALGLAASMGAGIRANFGTMAKPLHVGRAAQGGVTAALLAADGFEADPNALDGQWGFFEVLGSGFDPEKISGLLGRPHSIVRPGVSIKPYPCGVLTHPSMDAMLELTLERDLRPEDIGEVVLFAGSNILNPIRYQRAGNELEAKFCLPFLLTAIIVSRKAGRREFSPEYIASPQVQALMARIRTEFDPQIEALGWDRIRSRVEVALADGQRIVRDSGETYRGGPDRPLTRTELEAKFDDCTEGLLAPGARDDLLTAIDGLDKAEDLGRLIDLARATA